MISTDNPLFTQPSAQALTRTAPKPPGIAQEQDQDAPRAGTEVPASGTASFARLVTLLRSPTLPGGDASASARITAAPKRQPGKSQGETCSTHDPVLAQTVITATKVAEQELRTATAKDDQTSAPDPRPTGESTQVARTTQSQQSGSVERDGTTSHPRSAEAEQAGGSGSQTAAVPHAQAPNAEAPHAQQPHPHSTRATAAGSTSTDAPTQAATRGASNQTLAPTATAALAVTRDASSRALISKLTHAAAPARGQVHQRHVADAAAKALGIVIKKGGGEATIRLRPEGLGQLKVNLKVHDAKVEATLSAQTSAARDLLTDSLPRLRSALEAQGLNVGRITVEPGGAPAAAQDARHVHENGAEAQAAAPDGSGTSPQQQSHDHPEPRSALVSKTPGGARSVSGTEAQDNSASVWAIERGQTSTATGALEWIA